MKKLLLGVSMSVILGIGAGLGYITLTGDSSYSIASTEQVYDLGTELKGDIAIEQMPFNVLTPTKFPFEVTHISSFPKMYGTNKGVEITYANDKINQYIQLRASEANIIPINSKTSGLEIKDITLSNGVKGQYLENDKVTIFYWKVDGLSYSIVASKGKSDEFKLTYDMYSNLINSLSYK